MNFVRMESSWVRKEITQSSDLSKVGDLYPSPFGWKADGDFTNCKNNILIENNISNNNNFINMS